MEPFQSLQDIQKFVTEYRVSNPGKRLGGPFWDAAMPAIINSQKSSNAIAKAIGVPYDSLYKRLSRSKLKKSKMSMTPILVEVPREKPAKMTLPTGPILELDYPSGLKIKIHAQ